MWLSFAAALAGKGEGDHSFRLLRTPLRALLAEVNSSKIALSALQVVLEDIDSAPRKRRELIQVSQLITILTNGALIFSELEPLVLQLGTSTEKWSTLIQWAKEKGYT